MFSRKENDEISWIKWKKYANSIEDSSRGPAIPLQDLYFSQVIPAIPTPFTFWEGSYEVTGELRKIGSAKGKDLVIRRYIWGLFKKVATFAQIRWARYHYIYAILCYIEEKIRVSLIEDSSRGRKTGWGSCIFSYFSNVSEIAWTFLKHCWNMKKKIKYDPFLA